MAKRKTKSTGIAVVVLVGFENDEERFEPGDRIKLDPSTWPVDELLRDDIVRPDEEVLDGEN